MNYITMKNYIYILSLSTVLSLLTSGCLANLSQLSWGALREAPNAVMLQLTPVSDESDNSNKVAVCTNGDTEIEGYIKKAILMWAEPIERDKHIKVVNCNESAKVKITTIPTNNPTGGTAAIFPTTGDINYAPGKGSFPVFLHEIGHAWGLCDQYNGVNNCDDSIEGHGNGNKNSDSIMGPTYPTNTELKEDDIEGIKYIASMDSIPTNAAWKDIDKTIETNDTTEEDGNSSVNLSGYLRVTKVKMGGNYTNTFVYTPDNTLSSSNLKVCLLDKSTCINSANSTWALGMVSLSSTYDGGYKGTPIISIKVNFPATIYLLDVDSSGKLKQYTSFTVEQNGIAVHSEE